MAWPTYPENEFTTDEIRRHNARQDPGFVQPGKPGIYRAAFDVWRLATYSEPAVHFWRSYSLDTSETAADWAARTFGDGVAQNHDEGPWRVPGLVNVDMWPIPTESALSTPLGVQAIADTMTALLAIAQLPKLPLEPEGLGTIPPPNTLIQRLHRSALGFTCATAAGGGCAVRAFIMKHEGADADEDASSVPYRARIEDRETGTPLSDWQAFDVEHHDDERAQLRAAVRAAKKALDLTGQPAQRHWPSTPDLVWRLTLSKRNIRIEEG